MYNCAKNLLRNCCLEVSGIMKSTRQRILAFLERQRAASVAELSQALQVTEADVRYHVSVLGRAGLVAPVGEDRPSGRGRPARRYGLADRTMKDNLGRLSGALLDELQAEAPPESEEALLRRVAGRLAGSHPSGGSPARRLVHAVQQLNEMNYRARWEAHAEGPYVTLGHCPYSAILPEHPELCRLDASLLEALTGEPARQTAKLARDAHGALFCRFAIGKPR